MAPTITSLRIVGTLQQTCQVTQQGYEETITYDIEADLDGKVLTPDDLATMTAAARTGVDGIALPIPFTTEISSTYGTLLCRSTVLKKTVESGKRLLWAVEFNNKPFSQSQFEQATQPNPTLRLPETWEDSERIEKPIREDKDGKPLTNTAGVEPLEPLMVPYPHAKLWTSMKMTARPAFYDALKFAINLNAVTFMGQTYAAKTLWFVPGGIGKINTENGVTYREVRWGYDHAPETWPKRYKRLSTGFEFRDSADVTDDDPPQKKLKLIKLRNGELPRSPMMLDSLGGFPKNQLATSAYYQDSNIFFEIDFLTAYGGSPLPGLGSGS